MKGLEIAIVETMHKNHVADIKYQSNSVRQLKVRITGSVYQNLQVGDLALVGFLGNNPSNPIIIDKIMGHDHQLIADSEIDDIHLRHIVKNEDGEITGSIEFHIDKDGNVTINFGGKVGNMALNLTGKEGKLSINSTGDISLETTANLSAKVAGGVSIESEKGVSIKASGKVKVESADIVEVTGAKGVHLGNNLKRLLANNLPQCIVTGAPHNIGNTKVKV